MEKYMKPDRFSCDPNSSTASKEWKHWFITFENFLTSLKVGDDNKLSLLINHVAPSIYDYIAECENYGDAIETLRNMYIKPKNEIFARHLLATRKQKPDETLDQYIVSLKELSKDCNYKDVKAIQYQSESIRDAFINGLVSNNIRQRLLENKTLDLQTAFDQARALDIAQRSSDQYKQISPFTVAATPLENVPNDLSPIQSVAALKPSKENCWFCGNLKHPRAKCPARDVICHRCKKRGHFSKCCQSSPLTQSPSHTSAAVFGPSLCTVTAANSNSPFRVSKEVIINDKYRAEALIDSGSTDKSFISKNLADLLNLKIVNNSSVIKMATSTLQTSSLGYCIVRLNLFNETYPSVKLTVLNDLCTDIILGTDFQELHDSIVIKYGGSKPSLTFCALTSLNTKPPKLFPNLPPNCKPIATKSRNYSKVDADFIQNETQRLIAEGIVEPSNSAWRAQVLVVNSPKKRMVVDYSQTINKYTQLDTYPLPKIDHIVNKLAQYKIFSTIDLKSAYHQIPIDPEERPYTAFESNGRLLQFCRMPFGITNGVACFQRKIDDFIQSNELTDTYGYLDNVTIGGHTQAHHDANLKKFLTAAKTDRLTFNDSKCEFSTTSLNLLGYNLSHGTLKPDPDRLRPLLDLPAPDSPKSLKRVVGMFAYYAKWIINFSDKIRPLNNTKSFPLDASAVAAFELLKQNLAEASIKAIDETIPFTVETDASEFAIAATLNQGGRPVAFHSRTLQASERHYSAVEKEAQSIYEAVTHWRHFLLGRKFTLITDQRSVAYMYDSKNSSKIKNDKILRWRIELSCFVFDIIYRPGGDNIAADAFSRVHCAITSLGALYQIHSALCHPGITRFYHYVKSKNLPYSFDDVKNVINSCEICCEIKPRYYKPEKVNLIKATQPFERLSIDFKGPLPSAKHNRYILMIIDEYSRFPFAYPCPNMSTETVIKCLTQLFSIFGMPSYIHSDRGPSLISEELRHWLFKHGIATSSTTPYNPTGNSQVERYNGVVWKAIQLALKTKHLQISQWELVITDALHSIRSLLCTSTNCTPHERFFNHSRRSSCGSSIPSWLMNPGPVLMKKNVRQSKYDPLVEEVELISANPQYANVKMPDGRETTVSLKQLAPKYIEPKSIENTPGHKLDNQNIDVVVGDDLTETVIDTVENDSIEPPLNSEVIEPRRSTRIRNAPEKLDL